MTLRIPNIRHRHNGMRGLASGSTTTVFANPGVTANVASTACTTASGTYDSLANTCTLPTLPGLPSWCDWVPFATSLFSECSISNAAINQTAASAYTIFQIGQKSGAAAGQAAADTANDMEAALPQTACTYQAAQNYPALSQILGPDLVAAYTNPLATGCTSPTIPGWAAYLGLAAIGIGVFFLLKK